VAVSAGEIMFSRSPDFYSDRRTDLYVARPDGSHLRLLVRNGANPAASPDGRLIAFERNGAIWVMNRDTSGQRAVTSPFKRPIPKGQYPGASDYGPAWSADGHTIYFTRDAAKTDTASLYRVTRDGTALRRLTFPKPTYDGHCHDSPSASPEGRLVAFEDSPACRHGTYSRIEAITTAGRPARLPFRFPREYFSVVAEPAWAPNGRLLAYMTMEPDEGSENVYTPQAIWLSSSDGSAARRIVDMKSYSLGSPAWSPDSRWIVFDRAYYDNFDIWRVRHDGGAVQKVTKDKADDSNPAWLPAAR
jgi:Tol biopolymer transport system component